MSTPDAENASPSPEHSEDEDADEMSDDKMLKTEEENDQSPSQTSNGQKSSTNPKDPNRQKRKKARRACLACQRAHLTCSDERPCERCIRRGLGDACQDGVRKKAKYLHDAPNEALIPPGMAGPFHRQFGGPPTQLAGMPAMVEHHNGAVPPNYFGQNSGVGMYPQTPDHLRMPPPGQDAPGMGPYSGTTTPISPPGYGPNTNPHQSPPMQNLNAALQQQIQSNTGQMQSIDGAIFDPSDPAIFNLDLASLNFGNHYGALEFGMLGHMSSGAGETPPNEASTISPLQQGIYNTQFADGSHSAGAYESIDWQIAHSRQGSTMSNPNSIMNTDQMMRQDSYPHAYSVAQSGNSMSASPGSTGQDVPTPYDSSPQSTAAFNNNAQQAFSQRQHQLRTGYPMQPINRNMVPRPRRRDTRAIYEDLKQPYPYTQAFHRLISLINTRFPKDKREKFARAMAVIRPSFLSCMKDLDEQDLIHQEQTFQRKLWGYEKWLDFTGTPTLIIRRSGEVAAVGREFCILSEWSENVLLGKDSNLNTNWDSAPDQQPSSRSSDRGNDDIPGQEALKPVFIAELLDHESVIKFYDDFARLAFNDARGSANGRIRLMRYRALADDSSSNGVSLKSGKMQDQHDRETEHKPMPVRKPATPASIECQMCWCVWHDQFDMPAMIILNFLPILDNRPENIRPPASTQQREQQLQHVASVR